MKLILDLETTGLNPKTDNILEVAAILVDDELCELGRFQSVVHFGAAGMGDSIDPVVVRMHNDNGLWAECDSKSAPALDVVGEGLQLWLSTFEAGRVELAGNAIHFDRAFLQEHLPKLVETLHYRMFDIGAFSRELTVLGVEHEQFADHDHRAMSDCENELATWRSAREALDTLMKGG